MKCVDHPHPPSVVEESDCRRKNDPPGYTPSPMTKMPTYLRKWFERDGKGKLILPPSHIPRTRELTLIDTFARAVARSEVGCCRGGLLLFFSLFKFTLTNVCV